MKYCENISNKNICNNGIPNFVHHHKKYGSLKLKVMYVYKHNEENTWKISSKPNEPNWTLQNTFWVFNQQYPNTNMYTLLKTLKNNKEIFKISKNSETNGWEVVDTFYAYPNKNIYDKNLAKRLTKINVFYSQNPFGYMIESETDSNNSKDGWSYITSFYALVKLSCKWSPLKSVKEKFQNKFKHNRWMSSLIILILLIGVLISTK